jgi:SAM-dependent methyltransferase
MNFTKLDNEIVKILCCALCKSTIDMIEQNFFCKNCGTQYLKCCVEHSQHTEYIYDFKIHKPSYCLPDLHMKWEDIQRNYEEYHDYYSSLDNYDVYFDEIDSVREIYTYEFNIKGSVLDVGGHQGRLRHYLNDNDVPLYISADPFLEVFKGLESKPNLLRVYPCLSQPCNFLSCYAEYLPFSSNVFDWVHMRSVLDHFQDPYFAIKEAYRVLKVGGHLLVGLNVGDSCYSHATNDGHCRPKTVSLLRRLRNKIEREGITGLVLAIKGRIRNIDDHMFHWEHKNLIDLLSSTRFHISKEHWQKPPLNMCIYVSAVKL